MKRLITWLVIVIAAPLGSVAGEPAIVDACRRFLAVEKREVAEASLAGRELADSISAYRGNFNDVINALSKVDTSNRQDVSGVLSDQRFSCPELADAYSQDMLHFFVPDAYQTSKPFGLIIFMHGGGRTTDRQHPIHVVSDPESDSQSIGLQTHFADLPFIIVAPSAPWNENTGARWNVPGADDYIGAVIKECNYRFNIDTDRVFLGGYSMGGFGAFHLCQRLSDRLAGGFVFSGAWKTTHWKAWTGLPLFLRHGINDASPNDKRDGQSRPRFTDVFYARSASRRMRELGLPHLYIEDDGNHAIRPATQAMSAMADWVQHPRRDPFANHVIAVSPHGWKATDDTPTPHCRWISIDKIGDGEIDFDRVILNGPPPAFGESPENFNKQTFELGVQKVVAGLVDARIETENRIMVQTENVQKFSIWLHPEMVDFSQPIHVSLNGIESSHKVTPNLLVALLSYERRGDWRLVYHAKIELKCDTQPAPDEVASPKSPAGTNQ
ncbi:MAG: hypothetical protein KDB00_01010 [Planctomycetales bacterium]|nr:hypothetical protein [Planctomycetales bacterium]